MSSQITIHWTQKNPFKVQCKQCPSRGRCRIAFGTTSGSRSPACTSPWMGGGRERVGPQTRTYFQTPSTRSPPGSRRRSAPHLTMRILKVGRSHKCATGLHLPLDGGGWGPKLGPIFKHPAPLAHPRGSRRRSAPHLTMRVLMAQAQSHVRHRRAPPPGWGRLGGGGLLAEHHPCASHTCLLGRFPPYGSQRYGFEAVNGLLFLLKR
jgi:hypothetical protein